MNFEVKIDEKQMQQQLKKLEQTANNAVFAKQINQSLGVARQQIESELKQSGIKDTGNSPWSKKYGRIRDHLRQKKKDKVEKTGQGNVNIMLDARLRFLEQGTYLSNPRRSNRKRVGTYPAEGKIKYNKSGRYKQGKSFGSIDPRNFLQKQSNKIGNRLSQIFEKIIQNELDKINKGNK